MVKCLPTMWETGVRSLGRKDPLEKEMATHSSILAWKIPWTEDPGRLQSMGSQKVRHDWVHFLFYGYLSLCLFFLKTGEDAKIQLKVLGICWAMIMTECLKIPEAMPAFYFHSSCLLPFPSSSMGLTSLPFCLSVKIYMAGHIEMITWFSLPTPPIHTHKK